MYFEPQKRFHSGQLAPLVPLNLSDAAILAGNIGFPDLMEACLSPKDSPFRNLLAEPVSPTHLAMSSRNEQMASTQSAWTQPALNNVQNGMMPHQKNQEQSWTVTDTSQSAPESQICAMALNFEANGPVFNQTQLKSSFD